MRYLKETCEMARAIREIEGILREKGVSISACPGGIRNNNES